MCDNNLPGKSNEAFTLKLTKEAFCNTKILEDMNITKTLGERIIGSNNQHPDSYIAKFSVKFKELIDFLNGAAARPYWTDDEFDSWLKLQSFAIDALEQSHMYAVKAQEMFGYELTNNNE